MVPLSLRLIGFMLFIEACLLIVFVFFDDLVSNVLCHALIYYFDICHVKCDFFIAEKEDVARLFEIEESLNNILYCCFDEDQVNNKV